MKDCSVAIVAKFIFEYNLSNFGYAKILMSDRGSYFLKKTIIYLLKELRMYHQKSISYHPQANGTVEAFNKILENAFMKIYNANRNDWDVCIPTILCAYRTTCKNLIGQTPFRLFYQQEVVIPMEYIMPNLRISIVTEMEDKDTMEEHLAEILELEEDFFLVGFHQQVEKAQEKAWHDRHIKQCTFKHGDLVLIYDSKFTKFPGKFQMC